MTDTPPPPEDDDGTVLARFREAVHALYLASLPDGLRPPGTDAAAAAAALAEVRGEGVHRLFRLHAVASNLNRRPDLVDDPGEPTRYMAEAVFNPANEQQAVDLLEVGLRQFARNAPGTGSALTPARWREFLRSIQEPGFLGVKPAAAAAHEGADQATGADVARDPVLVWKPGCNDEEVTDSPAGAACTIRSRFYLDLDPREAGEFIDPANWVQYGRPFWAQMAVVRGTRNATADGYDAVFEEKVRLPVVGEVTARLKVSYVATDDYVVTRYEVAGPPHANPHVSFDNGWLVASRVHDGAQGRSVVEGLKSIRFVDPALNSYPDLACDGGWVHFMINMALGGDGLPPLSPRQLAGSVPPVTDPASVAAAVGRALDTWVAGAKVSLDGHSAHTKAAMAKMLADPPDPRWVNDLLAIGGDAPKAAEAAVSSLRAAFDEFAKLGGNP